MKYMIDSENQDQTFFCLFVCLGFFLLNLNDACLDEEEYRLL